jgi:hypothetical protein
LAPVAELLRVVLHRDFFAAAFFAAHRFFNAATLAALPAALSEDAAEAQCEGLRRSAVHGATIWCPMQIQCSGGSVRKGSGHVASGQSLMLTVLKVVQTFIWLIMTTANFTGFYLAVVGRFNWMFFLCVALLGGEIVVILANSWHCPLTDVMAKYTTDRQANFDIYLPEWLAANNIKIFTVLLVVETLIVLFHSIFRMS